MIPKQPNKGEKFEDFKKRRARAKFVLKQRLRFGPAFRKHYKAGQQFKKAFEAAQLRQLMEGK